MLLISFSLFGDAPQYQRGMLCNAKLAPVVYPNWRVRVYHDDRITCAAELRELGVELVPMERAPGGLAMCWRFLPMADPRIDRVIVRDADSRLNVREAAAVAEWIASGKTAHSMVDHDHHRCYPLFGGMIGCKGGALPLMPKWMDRWPKPWRERMDDMDLLNEHAWPLLKDSMCRHASHPNIWGGEPFPPHPEYHGFVGEQVAA